MHRHISGVEQSSYVATSPSALSSTPNKVTKTPEKAVYSYPYLTIKTNIMLKKMARDR